MPAIARYDSWKPGDPSSSGVMAACAMRDAQNMFIGTLFLWVHLAVSLNDMKRKALTIEAPAPVIRV